MHSANSYYINTIFRYIILGCSLGIVLSSRHAFAQDQTEIQIANEYVLKGEKEKALTVYQSLLKKNENIVLVHNNYLNLLLDMGRYKDAENYVNRVIKTDDKITYKLDLGRIYIESGDAPKGDKYLKPLIKSVAEDFYKIRTVSEYLATNDLLDYAVFALEEARKATGNNSLFTLELANFYKLQGKREAMVQEYLNYVVQSAGNMSYVQTLLQSILTKPEELEILEKLLYDKVQQEPNTEVYVELLIWVNLQQKNFYGAFIQSRGYDKRFKKEPPKTLEIAQIALNNQDYENADKAFTYVVKEYAKTDFYLPARRGQIGAREAKVRRSFPVNKDSVRFLIGEYASFIKQYPDNPNALEARLNQSLLHAYFLDEKDSAVIKLTALIENPRTMQDLRSRAKLELADVYILKEEPWESTLLYSQVERAQKETPIGYEAKLRNAKLSYYKGEFNLAMEHLDILKQATTREIANDAMELSIRIKENTAFDTIGTALKEYSAIELLLYQNKIEEALTRMEQLKKGIANAPANTDPTAPKILTSLSNKAILDDVYWLEANLKMKQGKFQESIGLLQRILDEYGEDILADDAYFLQGDIYERQLKDKDKAMEIYREFLNKYPGSVHVAEARKRFRQLRGDFEKPNQ